jgi:hypothetical protein
MRVQGVAGRPGSRFIATGSSELHKVMSNGSL